MNIFDIMGPVMVGPSSSHTAGAVRIGLVTAKLFGSLPMNVRIGLSGSFAATGVGHGTDKALVAGILEMRPDDIRIPDSFAVAESRHLVVDFYSVLLRDAHPNSALINVTGKKGESLEVQASSLGGGRIMVNKIDGIDVNFAGVHPTLIVRNMDQPGQVAEVTSMLSKMSVNIGTMQIYRDKRGGDAIMVIETDQRIPNEIIEWLRLVKGILKVTYLDQED